jgi:hypothetical protein
MLEKMIETRVEELMQEYMYKILKKKNSEVASCHQRIREIGDEVVKMGMKLDELYSEMEDLLMKETYRVGYLEGLRDGMKE